jgi:hypothetical protein
MDSAKDDNDTGSTAADVRGLEFIWGSDADPEDFLRDVNLAVAAGGRQYNDNRLMDVAVSCCDTRLRARLNTWREEGGQVPGAGAKYWYANKAEQAGMTTPDWEGRPTWKEFKRAFVELVGGEAEDLSTAAYTKAMRKQTQKMQLHNSDFNTNMAKAGLGCANPGDVAKSTLLVLRQGYHDSLCDHLPKQMVKQLGQGQDPRSIVEKSALTNKYTTVGQSQEAAIVQDMWLDRIAKSCGLKTYLAKEKASDSASMEAAMMAAALDDRTVPQSDSGVVQLIKESEVRVTERAEQLETRVEGKLTAVREQVATFGQHVTETGLGVKQILQKMDSAAAPAAPGWGAYNEGYQGYNGTQPSWGSGKGSGKGGSEKGGKGSGGKGGKGWQGGRSIRRCWKYCSTEHLMSACDKATQDKAAVNAVQDGLTWYGEGGGQNFSSWEVVNQFTGPEALHWDNGVGCYWVDAQSENSAYQKATEWVMRQGNALDQTQVTTVHCQEETKEAGAPAARASPRALSAGALGVPSKLAASGLGPSRADSLAAHRPPRQQEQEQEEQAHQSQWAHLSQLRRLQVVASGAQ